MSPRVDKRVDAVAFAVRKAAAIAAAKDRYAGDQAALVKWLDGAGYLNPDVQLALKL